MSLEAVALTALGGIVVAVLGYLGVRDQNRTAKSASDSTTQSAATTSALAAWESLLEPYREEVEQLRGDVSDLREREKERDRKIVVLTEELHRWQRVAKTIARWAVTMRDQLRGLGHEVPAEPDELMTLQIVSDVDDLN